jgi:hypothetical protein
MPPSPSLDTGLLIGTQNKFIVFELFPVPNPLIEVKDSPGFFGKLRISGENPGTMLPRFNSILIQPSPHRTIADRSHKTGLASVSCNSYSAPTGKGHLMRCRQLTCDSFNLNDEIWGEKTGGDPAEDVPQGLEDAAERNVFATC